MSWRIFLEIDKEQLKQEAEDFSDNPKTALHVDLGEYGILYVQRTNGELYPYVEIDSQLPELPSVITAAEVKIVKVVMQMRIENETHFSVIEAGYYERCSARATVTREPSPVCNIALHADDFYEGIDLYYAILSHEVHDSLMQSFDERHKEGVDEDDDK